MHLLDTDTLTHLHAGQWWNMTQYERIRLA